MIQKQHNIYFFFETFDHFKYFIYLCTIACFPLGARTGDLIYEKDVFERLSLWNQNLANSITHKQADDNRDVCVVRIIYTVYIYSYWRGLTALSILCGLGNAKALVPRMGRRTAPTPFLYTKKNRKKRN